MFYNFAFVNKMTKLDTACKKHTRFIMMKVLFRQDAEALNEFKKEDFRDVVSG